MVTVLVMEVFVAQVLKKDLLRMFTDEGDMLLGRLLETEFGRLIYREIEESISLSVDRVFDLPLAAHPFALDLDRNRVLVLKLIEKAVTDFIREKLK